MDRRGGRYFATAELMDDVISPILDRFGVPAGERPYLMAFYLNGLLAVVEKWVRGGCEEPIDRIAAVMQRCCSGS